MRGSSILSVYLSRGLVIILALLLLLAVGLAIWPAGRGLKLPPEKPEYSPEGLSRLAEASRAADASRNTGPEALVETEMECLHHWKVVSENGEAIPGVRAMVVTLGALVDGTITKRETLSESNSDSDGRVATTDGSSKENGTLTVFTHSAYCPAIVEPDHKGLESEREVIVVLPEGATIRGQVKLEGGNGVAGVRVLLLGATAAPELSEGLADGVTVSGFGGFASTISGEDGRFEVTGLENRPYRVEVAAEGLIRADWEGTPLGRAGEFLEIVVRPGAFCRLRFVDSQTAAPVAGLERIEFRPVQPGSLVGSGVGAGRKLGSVGEWTESSKLHSEGMPFVFRVHEWPIRSDLRAVVLVNASGYVAQECEVALSPMSPTGQAATQDVFLDPSDDSGTVEAVFVDRRGDPLRGLRVQVPLGNKGGKWRATLKMELDSQGRATFRLPPGEYMEFVRPEASPLWRAELPTVSRDSSTKWHFMLTGCYLRIRLYSQGDGESVWPEGIRYLVSRQEGLQPAVFSDELTEKRAREGLPVLARKVRLPTGVRLLLRDQVLGDGSILLGPFQDGLYSLRLMSELFNDYEEQIDLTHGDVVWIEAKLRASD